jgi:predicted kinase
MKTVILTSGPRGSGKTTYVNSIRKENPEVIVISRDEILLELYGTIYLKRYWEKGSHIFVWNRIREILESLSEKSSYKVILDYWNKTFEDREQIINKLRDLGAERIICWKFVVSLDACLSLFSQKDDICGSEKYFSKKNFYDFYRDMEEINNNGFDFVETIDPFQRAIPNFPLI